MADIVKCPKCNEPNMGGQLYCIKCQMSLIGIPREQGESSLPEPDTISPSPTNTNSSHSTWFSTSKLNEMLSKIDREKIPTIKILGGIYVFTVLLDGGLSLLQTVGIGQCLGFTFVLFALGLIYYATPTRILLRFDRGTGHLLSKLGPFESSGFERASTFYEIFGLMTMLIAIAMNVIVLFVQ